MDQRGAGIKKLITIPRLNIWQILIMLTSTGWRLFLTTTLCVSICGRFLIDIFAKIDDLDSNCVEFGRFSHVCTKIVVHIIWFFSQLLCRYPYSRGLYTQYWNIRNNGVFPVLGLLLKFSIFHYSGCLAWIFWVLRFLFPWTFSNSFPIPTIAFLKFSKIWV